MILDVINTLVSFMVMSCVNKRVTSPFALVPSEIGVPIAIVQHWDIFILLHLYMIFLVVFVFVLMKNCSDALFTSQSFFIEFQ